MNAHWFYQFHGKEMCERIVERAPIDKPHFARYYSEETGSYYNKDKGNCVNLRELKDAICNYSELDLIKKRIEKELLK